MEKLTAILKSIQSVKIDCEKELLGRLVYGLYRFTKEDMRLKTTHLLKAIGNSQKDDYFIKDIDMYRKNNVGTYG